VRHVIIKGRIIDGTGAEPIDRGIVVVQGSRIEVVGSQGDVKVDASEKVIDAGEKTILPGLVDSHVHFCMTEGLSPYETYGIAMSTIFGVENAKAWMRAGVTTVRDLGCAHHGIFALRDAIEKGTVVGPRIIAAGAILTESGRNVSLGVAADGPDEFRKRAREQIGAGAQWIKIYASGQNHGRRRREPWEIWATVPEVTAACEEAHNKGLKAAAHCATAESALVCLEGSIDSIEHGLVLNDQVLRKMKEQNVYYVPTAYVHYLSGNFSTELGWLGPEDAWLQERLRMQVNEHERNVKRAAEIGVKIVAGTDFSGFYQNYNHTNILPPDLMANELQTLVKYGVDPMTVIRSATQVGAEMLGMEGTIGTIEKGKLADLAIFDGDPLSDMSALNPNKMWAVMKEGRILAKNS
jgi:imidazolonepropionase-like amidohydrolase